MDEQTAPPQAVPAAAPATGAPVVYKDEDLVYVDPESRTVVGFVEFTKAGNAKAMPMKVAAVEEEEDEAPAKDEKPGVKGKPPMRRRIQRQRFYPWGTYRTMKKVYKIEGKQRSEPSQKTLDEVMEKALQEPFWD